MVVSFTLDFCWSNFKTVPPLLGRPGGPVFKAGPSLIWGFDLGPITPQIVELTRQGAVLSSPWWECLVGFVQRRMLVSYWVGITGFRFQTNHLALRHRMKTIQFWFFRRCIPPPNEFNNFLVSGKYLWRGFVWRLNPGVLLKASRLSSLARLAGWQAG